MMAAAERSPAMAVDGTSTSRSRSSRQPNKVVAAATAFVLLSRNAYAKKCVDDASYVSPMNFPCAAYAQLNCDGFRHVGWTDEATDELLKKCPTSCQESFCDEVDTSIHLERSLHHGHISDRKWVKAQAFGTTIQSHDTYKMVGTGGGTDKQNLGGTADGNRNVNVHLVPPSYCPSDWDDTCRDDPLFHTHVGFHCEAHANLDCAMFERIGFTEQEVHDLINACPCSCQVECGTWTMSPTPVPTHSPTETMKPSQSPSDTPTAKPSVTPSATPSSSPTRSPSISPSVAPTSQPSDVPSDGPSPEPSPVPSSAPSHSPSTQPTSDPSPLPSIAPSHSPTAQPTNEPSPSPSIAPSESPSGSPSSLPTSEPSAKPSAVHSSTPTVTESEVPSQTHSSQPSESPSSSPTQEASSSPSLSHSSAPSSIPSSAPSGTPTLNPSSVPTQSSEPSTIPTLSTAPSSLPSFLPSNVPTISPSAKASNAPSALSSGSPSTPPAPTSVEMATIFTIPLELNNNLTATDAQAMQIVMKAFLQRNQIYGEDNAGAKVTIVVSDVHVDEIIPRSSLTGDGGVERRMKKASSSPKSSKKSKQGGDQGVNREDVEADDIGNRVDSSPAVSVVTSEVAAKIRILCNVFPHRPLEVDPGFEFVPRLLGGFAAGDFEPFLYQLASSSGTFASPRREEEQIVGDSTNHAETYQGDEFNNAITSEEKTGEEKKSQKGKGKKAQKKKGGVSEKASARSGSIAAATEQTSPNASDESVQSWDKGLTFGVIVGVAMVVVLLVSAAIIRRKRNNVDDDEFEGSAERPTIFYDEEGRQVIMAPRGSDRYVPSAPTPTNAVWKEQAKQASSTRSKKRYAFSPKGIVDDDSRSEKSREMSRQEKQWGVLQQDQMKELERTDNWEQQQLAGSFPSKNSACDSSVVGLVVNAQDDGPDNNNGANNSVKEKRRGNYNSRLLPSLRAGKFGGQIPTFGTGMFGEQKPPPITPRRRSYFHLDSRGGSPASNAPQPPSHNTKLQTTPHRLENTYPMVSTSHPRHTDRHAAHPRHADKHAEVQYSG